MFQVYLHGNFNCLPVNFKMTSEAALKVSFFRDSVAHSTIACQTSMLFARAKMTQVTLIEAKQIALKHLGIRSDSFKLLRTCV